ncbi:hypothetical protein VKT23_004103 [Stygiomarasmius scandens]|uniref:Uncharacterized protein n=1 Tax=Marasmiellus scandens TaxID=2682957 RepID=A0ABR1JT98_9AGAR
MTIPYPPLFLKLRNVAFSIISGLATLWIVLLCCYVFTQWGGMDHLEKPFVFIMILNYTLTVIMLLVLIILPFRPWLDGARMFLLLITHIGLAILYVCWNSRFSCPNQTPDQQGTCRLLNIYILLASWVIPLCLVAYSAGLAFMVYRHPRANLGNGDQTDIEKIYDRGSILPVMSVRHPSSLKLTDGYASPSLTEFTTPRSSQQPFPPVVKKHHSSPNLFHLPTSSQQLTQSSHDHRVGATTTRHFSLFVEPKADSTSRKSARLSKPLPTWML